jgi:flagellar basal body-associated protein FliL
VVLSGCNSLFDGYYSSVKPHEQQANSTVSQNVSAANYNQLYSALTNLIKTGRNSGVIIVGDYNQATVEADMEKAVSAAMHRNAIAAYAVREVHFELGKSGGKPALDIQIEYVHNRAEIMQIKHVADVQEAVTVISGALNQCQADIVLHIRRYEQTDFVQAVESYAMENPQYVMELPQVTVNVYPETGATRVVELRFTYQTSRDSLRSMQQKVQPVFESALLYVSGDAQDQEKYEQLDSFLMERYDYKIETSITPAYSLLRHGVGDSRAFAVVYAAMCRQAGLECLTVSGTRAGESHYWNMICDDGIYYHVDLLDGDFQKRTDQQMEGYVWDYSAYPACGVPSEEYF